LLSTLGKGGMGEVFLVADGAEGDRELALKVYTLPPSTEGWAAGGHDLERFRREFLTLSRLRHASLPRVHDFGLIPERKGAPLSSRWFFTYDHVEGQDLFQWSREHGPEALFRVASELVEVLRFLHARGILHLDVKPTNIIVQGTASGPRAVLIDFGVVRRPEHLELNQTLGTLPYLAPEILRGEEPGPGADFFSLGVTLFECLFRERPYRGGSPEEILRDQLRRLPAPPPGRKLRGAERIEGLIWRLLAPEPARRMDEPVLRPPEPGTSLGNHLFANRPVGMEPALEALFGAYHAITNGLASPSLVAVEGEAGSGKSRLLAEFKDMVQVSGGRFQLISLRALEPRENQGPRAVAEALLAMVGQGTGPARAFAKRTAPPSKPLSFEVELAQARREQERLRYFEAVWDLLRAAVLAGPLVFAFDDVDPADASTVSLLSYLARNLQVHRNAAGDDGGVSGAMPGALPALLCFTYRREEAGRMALLRGEPAARRVRLPPLTRSQVRSFLENAFGRRGLTSELVAALHASSRGNPFVLVETLKSLLDEGAIVYRPGRPLEIHDPPARWKLPGSVRELLEKRWRGLSPGERRLAAHLSPAQGGLSSSDALELSPFPSSTTSRMLERLEERLIITRRGQGKGSRLILAHPYLVDLARSSLGPQAASRVYRRLARLRERQGAGPEELALLLLKAGEGKRALAHVRCAECTLGEPGGSPRFIALYEELLSILRKRDPSRAEISLKLARARSLLGDHRGALLLLEEIPADEGSGLERARRLALLAGERICLRQFDRARAEFEEAERLLLREPRAWEEAVTVRLGLCRLESEAGEVRRALGIARDCLSVLKEAPAGDQRDLLQSTVLSRQGSLHAQLGEFPGAIEAYRRGYHLLRNQPDSLDKGGLCCNLGNLHTARGDYHQAIAHYRRAQRVAERIGARDLQALVGANLGLQYLYRWDLAAAEEAIRSSVRLAEGIGAKRYLRFARLCLGTLLARRGSLQEAIDLLQKELLQSRQEKDTYLSVNLSYQIVKARLDRGEFARALGLLRIGRRLAREIGRSKSIMEGNLILGASLVYLGDFQGAIKSLEAAQGSPAEHHPQVDAEILLFQGLALGGAGKLAEAEDCLRRSCASFEALKSPVRVCEARAHLASPLAAAGRMEKALRLSDQAWRFLGRIPRDERPVIVWAEVLAGRARLLLPGLSPGNPALLELFHELSAAREALLERGARRLQWQLSHLMGTIHQRLGNEEEGRALVLEARRGLLDLCEALPPSLSARLRATGEARTLLADAARAPEVRPVSPHSQPAGPDGTTPLLDRIQRLEEAQRSLLDENRRLREENEKLGSRVATQKVELARRERRSVPATASPDVFFGLVGRSPAMQRLFALIERVAPTDLPVLVRGETGTGKELVLRAIHQLSSRRDGPFIAESLTAIPPGLLESELFGHAEGAFSGAARAKTGRLAEAAGGSLCLAEIDELSLEVQSKLLRVLDSGQVRPLGSSELLSVDFRLLASTRRDLRQAIAEGRFQENLLYRLAGVELVVPPLRERIGDLPHLIGHFLMLEEKRTGRRLRIDDSAMERWMAHDWPGNVRELENEIRRLALLRTGRIRAADLQTPPAGERRSGALPQEATGGQTLSEAREKLDRAHFEAALRRHGGNLKAVARELGVHERSVYKIRRRLGLH
jgi:DNA-binding NtrC family response regulator